MGTHDGDAKLDAAVDDLFRRARTESSDDSASWDDRADVILAAAHAAPSSDAVTESLLAAPDLEPEPGESQLGGAGSRPISRNGKQMSEDSSSKPPPSRRPSLKELAESVKNRPSTPAPSSVSGVGLGSDAAPGSVPGSQRHSLKDTLVALDGQLPAPPSARPSTPAPLGQRGSAPPSSAGPSGAGPSSAGPSSAGPSSVGPSSAGPSSVAPASAPPSSAGPASAPPVAAAPTSPVSNPAAIPSTKPSPGVGKASAKQGSGAGVGIVIAVVGLAAAAGFGLYMKSRSEAPAAPTVAAVETAAPAAEPESVGEAPEAAAKPEEEKQPEGVLDLSQLDDANAASSAPILGGPLPKASASAAAAPSAVAAAEPSKPAGPNEELGDAIRNRAGGGAGVGEDAVPAAAEGSKKNLPDVPPTGAVTSAVNAVKGGAKGCVAGADEPSSATITFGPSGSVQSVTVGGWAAGKSAAGCIKSALQSAKVPPFARPSYSTSVTIRP